LSNPSKRGRKTLLGEQLDSKVQFFIKPVRDSGRVGNSAKVRAVAKGIVLPHDISLLFENGGHIELAKSWIKVDPLAQCFSEFLCDMKTVRTFVFSLTLICFPP
jgi:hypothetical protein